MRAQPHFCFSLRPGDVATRCPHSSTADGLSYDFVDNYADALLACGIMQGADSVVEQRLTLEDCCVSNR